MAETNKQDHLYYEMQMFYKYAKILHNKCDLSINCGSDKVLDNLVVEGFLTHCRTILEYCNLKQDNRDFKSDYVNLSLETNSFPVNNLADCLFTAPGNTTWNKI